jgi:hypothetical protein
VPRKDRAIPTKLERCDERGRPGRRSLPRWVAGLAAAAATVLALNGLAACGGSAGASTDQPIPTPTGNTGDIRVWPKDLIYPSERSFKADQIEALGYDPQVVFFGGSRSVRFDPAYLQKKTGLRGFNLAMTNGLPVDALAFAHFLHARAPDTRPLWIWGIQTSTLYPRNLEPGLIQDPRLNKYLPASLLREEAVNLTTDPAKVPKVGRVTNRRYTKEGMIVYNPYDAARAKGLKLERALQIYTARTLPKLAEEKTPDPTYFEKTLGLLNSYGITPVLVSMPVQPQVLATFREHGWQQRQDEFVAYIDGLHEKYDFRFIDLSDTSSFGGDPRAFYDGVHMDASNARKLVDKLTATFPDLFTEAGGS